MVPRFALLALCLISASPAFAQGLGGGPVLSDRGRSLSSGDRYSAETEAGVAEADASVDRDLALMHELFDREVRRMNASGERFAHPVDVVGGVIGNNLYKFQNTDNFVAAGPLFDRLYNGGGRYRNIKECYDQAENVLGRLRRASLENDWALQIADTPGHYWATATLNLHDGRTLTLHLDPWKGSTSLDDGRSWWQRLQDRWNGFEPAYVPAQREAATSATQPRARGGSHRGAIGAFGALGE